METFLRALTAAFALATASVLAFNPNTADARVTRSCSATMTIGAASPFGLPLHGASYPFSGQGTAGGLLVNKARERARENLDECIDDAWAQRHRTSRPAACTASNQVYGYPFYSLQFGLQQTVCLANPGYDSILVNLTVQFSGDTGCLHRTNYWNRVVTQAYTVQCPRREVERGADRPGMDYRHFAPRRASYTYCRRACMDEYPTCRAWTYVPPRRGGPRGTCWLKSGVPGSTPCADCISGVITEP